MAQSMVTKDGFINRKKITSQLFPNSVLEHIHFPILRNLYDLRKHFVGKLVEQIVQRSRFMEKTSNRKCRTDYLFKDIQLNKSRNKFEWKAHFRNQYLYIF